MCRHPRSHRPYHFACRLCRTNSVYLHMICRGFLPFMCTVYRDLICRRPLIHPVFRFPCRLCGRGSICMYIMYGGSYVLSIE